MPRRSVGGGGDGRSGIIPRSCRVRFLLLLLLLVGALSVLPPALPGWVERALSQRLERAGIPVRGMEVLRITPTSCEMANIELGPAGAVRVDSLRIAYDLRGLIQGRVDAVEAGGVEVRITEALHRMATEIGRAASGPAGPGSGASPLPPVWPFRSVQVRAALVHLSLPPGRVTLPMSADARVTDGRLQVDGRIETPFGGASFRGMGGGEDGTSVLEFADVEVRVGGLADLAGLATGALLLEGPLRGTATVTHRASDPDRLEFVASWEQGLDVEAAADSEPVRILLSLVGDYRRGAGALNVEGTVRLSENRLRWGDLRFAADLLEMPWGVSWDGVGRIRAAARLNLAGGELAEGEAWRVEGLSGEIPWGFPEGAATIGRVAASRVTAGELDLGGVTGEATVGVPTVVFRLRLDLVGGRPVLVRVDPLDPGLLTEVRVPAFEIADAAPLADLLRRRFGVTASGTIEGEARMSGAVQDPFRAEIRLIDGVARLEKAALEGVRGGLVLNGINPLRSEPRQSVTVDRLVTEALTLTNGTIRLAVENEDQVFVEENQWEWAGGRLSSRPFRYRPSRPAVRLELLCEGIALDPVLDLILGEQVTGDGRLYGRIPMALQWDPPRFALEGGYLYAAPGTYSLRIQDPAIIGPVVEAAAEGVTRRKEREQLQERVLASLRDFEYRAFRIDFRADPSGLPGGTLQIVGEGKGEVGVPLILDLRFSAKRGE